MKWFKWVLITLVVAGCGQKDVDVVTAGERFQLLTEKVQQQQTGNLHSLVVWQDGIKELELYRSGSGYYGLYNTPNVPSGPGELHNVHSVTKSFVATLIFIAVDEGRLEGLDVPVFSLFPEYEGDDRKEKQAMTVRDLLDMSAGYALDELSVPYGTGNPFNRHYMAPDLKAQFLETRLAFEPGSKFCYSGMSTVGLSKIVEQLYGEPFAKVMKAKLFDPLGITNYRWIPHQGSGEPGADWGLMIDTEAMGRFGQMWLNRGVWQGKQIVAAHWAEEVSKSRFGYYSVGYGMHFWQWKDGSGAYAAQGYGEQYIVVVPDKNAVIVATGGNYHSNQMTTAALIQSLIRSL